MKKKTSKQLILIACLVLTAVFYGGCSRKNDSGSAGNEAQSEGVTAGENSTGTSSEENVGDETGDSSTAGEEGKGTGDGVDSADSSENANDGGDSAGNAPGNLGDGSVGEDIENAAQDVADQAGDAVDDMAGIDYSDYDSAQDYLFGQIGGTDGGSKYEVRNEDREAKNYDTSDSSKMGYRYEVYDTSEGDGKKYGVFYVDRKTGKIYKESGDQIEEYQRDTTKNNQ